jgi:CRISPR/Cas system CSM-associated protein Csm3 (group 7 of RAMP superfamily)
MPIKIRIEFETSVHHGSGFGLAGIVDRALLRDENGMPYLAGSALKGKFRFAALQMRSAGVGSCGGHCRTEPRCLVCWIFGSTANQGAAVFHDAFPMEPERTILREQIGTVQSEVLAGGSDVRASTAIDRCRGVVKPHHLFSTETLPPLIRFESKLGGRLPEGSVEFLRQCAKLLTHFGGDSARGLGLCRYTVESVAEGA